MQIDVVDGCGGDVRVGQRALHGQHGAGAFGVWAGGVKGVAAQSGAGQYGEHGAVLRIFFEQ